MGDAEPDASREDGSHDRRSLARTRRSVVDRRRSDPCAGPRHRGRAPADPNDRTGTGATDPVEVARNDSHPPASRPPPSSARWSWEARSSSAQGVDRMPSPRRRRSKHRRRRVPVPRSPRSRPTKRTATESAGLPPSRSSPSTRRRPCWIRGPGLVTRRGMVVNLTQVVAVATDATDALALLHPPSFVAADHAADVTHHRDSIAILSTAIAKLQAGEGPPDWR